MYYELSKREKKIARQCIDKGLHIAYTEALEEAGLVISDWHSEKINTRDAYMRLYNVIKEHDYAIARRYNSLSGSRWLGVVAQLFAEKKITEDDISDLSEETRNVIYMWAR